MYAKINPNELNRPGDFTINDIRLVSYQSADGDNQPKKMSIKTLVTEINIYESIFNKHLSGSIILLDAQNLLMKLPITGFERIEFSVHTPSMSKGFDFREKTGHPMYIYAVKNRKNLEQQGTMYYQLMFCSGEMMRNERVRVTKPFQTNISDMVTDIVREKDGFNSQKDLFVEPTKGVYDFVTPRVRPNEAIDLMSKKAQSEKHFNAGYLFYETSFGYNFRSLESMLAGTNTVARPVVARYEYKTAGQRDGKGNKDILSDMQAIMDYNVKEQTNTLKNSRNGVYCSRLISHDAFKKSFSIQDFDYHNEYEKSFHTEHDKDGGKTEHKSIAPLINVEDQKFVSDYPEGVLIYTSDTTESFETTEGFDSKATLQKRMSQRMAFESFKLELTLNGFTGLSCGDLVAVNLPAFTPKDDENPLETDPYMSGRYLVSTIHHEISPTFNKHIMNVEVLKDAVRTPYPNEIVDTFTGREKEERGVINQYTIDELLVDGSNPKIMG